jgi:NTE family protein
MGFRYWRQVRLCLLLILATATTLPAAHAAERVGLVLGGGGARGAAHIGVLKVLERERIPIHAITGTSIGAIVGALYSAGYSPEEIERIIGSIDWADIFHDGSARTELPMRQKETDLGILANLEVGFSEGRLTFPTTLVRGQKLGLLLRRLFLGRGHIESFDDLPIPFRCVATDIGVVRPVVFESGDLALAVRASMAVPGAFAPVHHDGKVLVDGGIVDNLPVDVARKMGVDRLIVVDVGQPLATADSIDTGLDVLLQMVNGLMRDRLERSISTLTEKDILLQPELGPLTSASFQEAVKGIPPGEDAALGALERLRALSVSPEEFAAWRGRQRAPVTPPPTLSFVRVDPSESATAEFVRDRISAEHGKPLDLDLLERDIRGAFGRGTYESISYHLEEDEDGGTGLEVKPVDAAIGRTVFRGGIQIDDDFSGGDAYQLNAEARVTGLTPKGAEWRTLVGLGRITTLATDFYLPFSRRGSWFVSPEVSYTALDQPVFFDDDPIAQYRVESWLGGLRLGRDLGDRLRISSAYIRGQDHAKRAIADPALPETVLANIGGIEGTVLWDSLDNVRFPRRGLRAELSYTSFDKGMGSQSNGNLMRASLDKAFGNDLNTVLLGARASLSKKVVEAFQTDSALGGLTYLSGLSEQELVDNQMLLFRAIYYRRITKRGLLFDLPMYIAGSLEGGNVWSDYDQVSLSDLTGASSVFLGMDLPIGPLQLGYGRTFDGRDSLYLTFGSLVLPRYR